MEQFGSTTKKKLLHGLPVTSGQEITQIVILREKESLQFSEIIHWKLSQSRS